MTVYEKVKLMSKEELCRFLATVYNFGWFDGAKRVDDEDWFLHESADSYYEMLEYREDRTVWDRKKKDEFMTGGNTNQ